MVIGDRFCCGGYGFIDAEEFRASYEKISAIREINVESLYVSHIIHDMLLHDKKFSVAEAGEYLDWGDQEAWLKFCAQYKTIFVDIDGVLVENSSEYFEPKLGVSLGLTKNIETINRLFDSGKAHIILITSRRSIYNEITEAQLQELGAKYHRIIYDLPHAQRILVNDFAISNPFPSAVAINLERDRDILNKLL
jgi:hypothetical protein